MLMCYVLHLFDYGPIYSPEGREFMSAARAEATGVLPATWRGRSKIAQRRFQSV